MALVAKAQKTVTRLDDGYTVRLAPAAIVIPANSDGTDPVLTSAKTRVFLDKADVSIAITISGVTGTGCTATFSGNEVSITALSALQGNVRIDFTGNDGYVGSAQFDFIVAKQGASGQPGANGISVWLSNETHAVPANHDGTLPYGALDNAMSFVLAHRNVVLNPVASNAIPGVGEYRFNIESTTGGNSVRGDKDGLNVNSAFKLTSMSADTAVITIKVYVEGMNNVFTKQMTLTKVKGLNPEIVDRVNNWTFTGTEEFDGSKIRAKSIVAAAIDVLNLFAQVVEATNLTVTGNSKIGPFSIDANGIFSAQSGALINAIQLKYSGFNWLYWNQLNYNRTAGLEIGKMGNDGILNIKASKNGGPTFTKGVVIDMQNGEPALEIMNGGIQVPSGQGATIKQQILVGYSSNNPYNPIFKYLNIDKGIITGITDS